MKPEWDGGEGGEPRSPSESMLSQTYRALASAKSLVRSSHQRLHSARTTLDQAWELSRRIKHRRASDEPETEQDGPPSTD